jgi:hypothetical protein
VKPEISRVLEVMAGALMADVAPHVAPSYRQASVFASALMLTSIREELDRVADRRVEENRALEDLLGRAVAAIGDPALRARVAETVAAREPGFRISALEARNARLRAVLIELHAHVETQTAPEARRVDAEIWRELAKSTERRRLSLGAF